MTDEDYGPVSINGQPLEEECETCNGRGQIHHNQEEVEEWWEEYGEEWTELYEKRYEHHFKTAEIPNEVEMRWKELNRDAPSEDSEPCDDCNDGYRLTEAGRALIDFLTRHSNVQIWDHDFEPVDLTDMFTKGGLDGSV